MAKGLSLAEQSIQRPKINIVEKVSDPLVRGRLEKLFDELIDRGNGVDAVGLYGPNGAPLVFDRMVEHVPKAEQGEYYRQFGVICRPFLQGYLGIGLDRPQRPNPARATDAAKEIGEPHKVRIDFGGRYVAFTPIDEDGASFLVVACWKAIKYNDDVFGPAFERCKTNIRQILGYE